MNTQTQTTQANETFALKKLKGIKPKGVKHKPSYTTLQSLLEIKDEFLDTEHAFSASKHTSFIHSSDTIKYNYERIYQKVSENYLKTVSFSEKNLSDFIFANVNNDLSNYQSGMLGLFTGCMLDMLFQKNKSKNQRTMFHINGQGNRFDNLFHASKFIDVLFVENFYADTIIGYYGDWIGGIANYVLSVNPEGRIVHEDTPFYRRDMVSNQKTDHEVIKFLRSVETSFPNQVNQYIKYITMD
ncbi:hypothetical protein HOK51_07740 [Candidatus Woesearchaeota archaeon]|jgi:hypothetical protein|nr:hypothetical protein [Candidatus Woesearchaeota archaeon]MBT6519716.1 hypothetical protein [Candidatus Woesearchaeota archaeon]MBT7368096.1 hypothetical protein [Candidatus Woesearchaeota archaeon]